MTTEAFIRDALQKFLEHHNIKDVDVVIERPKETQFGDYATNLAMQLARHLRKKPKTIAEDIKAFIPEDKRYISRIEIAGPGFINFFASNENLYHQLRTIRSQQESYGKSKEGNGKSIQIEFVSANPTGPLTVGHGRPAVLGDAIARLYEALGYAVTREYYFNNAGRQMRILGESVYLRYKEQLGESIDFPDDYYQGEYIREIARSVLQEYKDRFKDNKDIDFFKQRAEEAIFEDIKNTISRLGFAFDVFYNEYDLYKNKNIDKVIAALKKKNLIEEREGATWFRTSLLGFDQDRVYIKSSGEPTYRLPDTAYHIDKVERGYDLMIDIFGADHIDTYPDVLAGLKALGYDTSRFKILIHQFVTLTEGGEKIKMSTRKANFVTLDELLDEVGVDVTRYFFLMRNMNAHLNFDLKLARTQSDENPVFYVQYAHARIHSILKLAHQRGYGEYDDAELNVLKQTEELNLIKHMIDFPATLKVSAYQFEPHRMVNYLFELATLFHKFYTECRVMSEDMELSKARLALIDACRIIFANGLYVLGISAPEQM